MSGEEKGDAKQEQTADDRRHDGAANMPLSQAARIARLKAAQEQNRAAQQTAARHAAAIDSVPAASYCPPAAAGRAGGQGPRTPDGHHAGVTARQAVEPDHRSGPESSLRDGLPDFDRRRARQAADHANPKAQAAVERLKELKPLDAKNHIRDEARGEAADEAAEPIADRAIDLDSSRSTRATFALSAWLRASRY